VKNERFSDANGDGVSGETLACIIKQSTLNVTVGSKHGGGEVKLHDDRSYTWVTAAYITAITSRMSPTTRAHVDGLTYEMVLNAETGECNVGCQTLTRAGCEQAFKALGAHLGYEITD
jgi:hypothetical protein